MKRALLVSVLAAWPVWANVTVIDRSVAFQLGTSDLDRAEAYCTSLAGFQSNEARGAPGSYGKCVTMPGDATPVRNGSCFAGHPCGYTCNFSIRLDDDTSDCPVEVCQDPGFIIGDPNAGVTGGYSSTAGQPGQLGYGRACQYNFDDYCAPDLTSFVEEEVAVFFACSVGFFSAIPFAGALCDLANAEASCPPGDETQHWTHVLGDDSLTTVTGIVAGGKGFVNATPGYVSDGVCAHGLECTVVSGTPAVNTNQTCEFPNVSQTDYAYQHQDRDFEVQLIPISGNALDPTLLSPANLRAKRGGGYATISIETEYMQLFPLQAASDPYSKELLDSTGLPYSLPPQYSPPSGLMQFPTAGDRAAVQGMLIWDCGHPMSDGSFETEIHPAVAASWIHPQGNHTSTVAMKAMSHSAFPSGTATPFTVLDADLPLADFDPLLDVCVGAPIFDYSGTIPQRSLTKHNDNDKTSTDPWANVTNFETHPSSLWNAEVTWTGSQVHVHVEPDFNAAPVGTSSVTINPHSGAAFTVDFKDPLLMGAHATVCQPVKDVNGNVTNGCTGSCTPSQVAPPVLSATVVPAITAGFAPLITLSWTPAGGGAYQLYRSTTPNAAFPSGYAKLTMFSTLNPLEFTDVASYNATYYYVVTAQNSLFPVVHEGPPSNVVAVTTPTAPALSVTSVGSGHVSLSWTAIEGAVAYELFRQDGASSVLDQEPLVTLAGLSYEDDSVEPTCAGFCPYRYWVVADLANGGRASSIEVLPQPLRVPVVVFGVQPIWLYADGIHLNFDDKTFDFFDTDPNNPNLQGSYLVRGPGGLQQSIDESMASTLTEPGAGPYPGTVGVEACYTVRSTSPQGKPASMLTQSDDLGPLCITPQATPPISGLSATPGNNLIGLQWTGSWLASSYRVYVNGTLTDTVNQTLNSETGSVFFTKTGLATGVAYSFQISAGGVWGWTALSAPVTATPPCNASTCAGGCCSGNNCLAGNQTATGCVSNGGTCGVSCAGGQACSGGACACARLTQAQACSGVSCGPADDGCGGSYVCGTCRSGFVCGRCDPGVCFSAAGQCP